MIESKNHSMYMKMTINLAKKGRGEVSPNPMVGCVIVKNNKIIGEGYHHQFGKNHAEIDALNNCIESPHDADLYVNLEPCNIYGKTPPCVNAIIKEGIKNVYIGVTDPNPEVNGLGIKELQKNSINVENGILYEECYDLNKSFFKWIETKRPWVIGKVAQTIDGYMGIDSNTSTWITNESSKINAHQLRSEVDAILIGKNTALVDNPSLTVREVLGSNPKRVILDTYRSLPLTLKIFNDKDAETIVLCSNNKFNDNETSFCKFIAINEFDGKLDLGDVLQTLGENGITSLLVEGGKEVLQSFYSQKLLDEIYIYSSDKNIKGASLKNPLLLNDEWEIKEDIDLSNDNLKIARKKTACLQE